MLTLERAKELNSTRMTEERSVGLMEKTATDWKNFTTGRKNGTGELAHLCRGGHLGQIASHGDDRLLSRNGFLRNMAERSVHLVRIEWNSVES